jgi:hypothetical protein
MAYLPLHSCAGTDGVALPVHPSHLSRQLLRGGATTPACSPGMPPLSGAAGREGRLLHVQAPWAAPASAEGSAATAPASTTRSLATTAAVRPQLGRHWKSTLEQCCLCGSPRLASSVCYLDTCAAKQGFTLTHAQAPLGRRATAAASAAPPPTARVPRTTMPERRPVVRHFPLVPVAGREPDQENWPEKGCASLHHPRHVVGACFSMGARKLKRSG